MSSNSVFCRVVGFCQSGMSSISRRTLERLLTLFNCRISIRKCYLPKNLLVGYCLKLAWSIDKFLPNLFCKLKYSDEVAYTETKAHRDLLLHNIESKIAKMLSH